MASSWRRSCLYLGLASSFFVAEAIASLGNTSLAQIIPDGTLPKNSIVTPQGNTSLIQGGTQAGSNLFHSFTQFSIPTGSTAYFNNDVGIQNIFSRVTGTSVSNIDGFIRANGTANLFLINPNGIIFGSNASLYIGGSFMGSTASSVLFADDTQFNAKDTQTQPLLTVNVPIGLQLGNNPAPISVQGSNLEVEPNRNLALVGGSVGLAQGKLTAPGGRIELGGLSTAGTVGINANGSLNFPDNVARSDVSLTNGAAVNVRAGGGGFITIHARNLAVSGGSRLRAGIADLGSSQTQAGDVVIHASGIVSFDGDGTKVENQVAENATGNAGNIKIATGSLFLNNDAELNAGTWGIGNAGKVIINASDRISMINNGQLRSRVNKNAVGNSGGIDITTGDLYLKFSGVSASTEGRGNSGSVIINANGSVLIERSDVRSRVRETGVGNSSGIYISADSITLIKKTELNASTLGEGNSGKVIVQANNSISLIDSEIKSRVYQDAVGDSGGITITSGILSIDETGLTATTDGTGNAGPITIKVSGSISLLNRSYVSSRVAEHGKGNSGGIYISAESLSLSDNAPVNASTMGRGNAGSIVIKVSGSISLKDRSFVNAGVYDTYETGVGDSGGIYISADSLSLTNKAGLNVSNEGRGNPGSIQVLSNSIFLDNQGTIRAESASGRGGNIYLATDLLLLRRNSLVSAVSGNPANNGFDGNINIDTTFLVAVPLENSDTVATGFGHSVGSNIQVHAHSIFGTQLREQLTPQSDIVATGTVKLNTLDVDPNRGLASLPNQPIKDMRVAEGCPGGGKQASARFFNAGRGGIAPNPYEPLSSSNIWEDVSLPTRRIANSVGATSVSASPATPANKIVEAQGWELDAKGNVVLMAEPTTATPHSSSLKPHTCHSS